MSTPAVETIPNTLLESSPASGIPALSTNRIARFAAIILLYFMQGLPLGLTIIAVPAWLAANGASPVAVGAFVGTALLPWSLKLFNGLLMDRFTFKPMGRRRSWILVAQAMMLLVFLALASAAPSAADVFALTAFFFTLNVCAVFNDVAVDGMTVDIVPHEERTTINGCMFAAQALGISGSAFTAGKLLEAGNITILALLLAAFVAIASGFVSLFRERPGERLMPWSNGQPSPECRERQQDAWWPILKGLFKALIVPTTLIFLIGIGLSQATFTFTDAVAPTLAVQQLGWTSEQYSSFASAMSLLAAVLGAATTPFLVKFFGLRNTIFGLFVALSLVALAGGLTLTDWQDARIFSVLFGLQYVLSTLLLIVSVVWAMRICNPAVAASLFALFMAVPNFARSVMSGWSGWVIEGFGYHGTYYMVAITTMVGLGFCLFARIGQDQTVDFHHSSHT
ncbi:MAG: MFS transporter [Wenzhouxiangella sp.]|jgi:PAT family beta-lactamase induction signal transducer AmpG|nr:MFS transporter [Wenzhouxiangella sp.]